MAEPKRPNSLVFNEALLKGFINGTLEPVVEEKVANLLESRPDLLERISAKSGDGFLKRLREVQERSTYKSPEKVNAMIVKPAVNNAAAPSDTSIPSALASYAGYKVVKELGRGGMGVVYLAKNIQMDRLEVLKVLNERLLDHEGAKERFLREIRAVSKLSHSNIVTSYSILPLENLLVFAMEYVHGIDLHQYTHKFKPLSVGLACSFAKQIAVGLQHAHEKGLVHRDIKPSNVIVYKSDGQLQLKILDFGLAKATSEEAAKGAGLTQDGTMLGTPEYMSPEQTMNAAKADIRADIYSLGCTLYYLLTGKPPFTGTHGAVLLAHAQREPAATNLLRPEVSTELAAVVGKMLAKDVRKRYQTPSEVAQALTQFVNQTRSSTKHSVGEAAKSNTVNDLNAPDRETSVEAPLSELALEADVAVAPQPSFVAVAVEPQPKPTASQPQKSVRRLRTKPKSTKWFLPTMIALGALIFFGLVWQIASFTFKTPNGTIVVENLPADAEVLVDGQKVEIAWNAGKDKAEVDINAGTHQLRVLNQGNEIFGDKVSIKGGDAKVVTLSVVKDTASTPQVTSDPFKVGSIWRDAKNSNRLTVLSRDGDKFSASFLVGPSIERLVKGTLAEGKVAWFGKDVRAVKGGEGADNFGTFVKDEQGHRIDFTWGNGGITNSKEGGKFVLRLDSTDGVNPQVPIQHEAATEPNQDWNSLSNRRDLTGWKQHPDSTGKWTVEQGEIVGRGVAPIPTATSKPTVFSSQSATTGMELILLQPGSFAMGSPNQEVGRQMDETLHQVSITKPFYLGKFEVSQAEFKQVTGFNPSKFSYSNLLPVENVSWYDAILFCNKLSERDGLQAAYGIANEKKEGNSIAYADVTWNRAANGYRLPTEAEWEYACRAGTASPFSFGDNITTSLVNYDGDYPYDGSSKGIDRACTSDAKFFTSNTFGLNQMHGNVCEWCWDWYSDYAAGPTNDPIGPNAGTTRVFRGGGWFNYAANCRSADRNEAIPAYSNSHRGFRVARSVVEVATENTSPNVTNTQPEPQPAALNQKPSLQFSFNGDGKDAVSGKAEFQFKNTRFRDNSLYLNGKYARVTGGYTAICKSPEINVEYFTVAMRFLAEGFGESNKFLVYRNNLITGGESDRWFSLERVPASGSLIVNLSNAEFSEVIDEVELENGKWTVVACSVDVPGRKVIVAVNRRVVSTIDLPPSFKLQKVAKTERLWTFTNYGNANVFQGLVDELITYDRALNADELVKIPLSP